MNVCWLNDLMLDGEIKEDECKCKVKMGGAETTISLLIKKGRSLGHEIKMMTPYNIDMEEIKKADLIFISNVHTGLKVRHFYMKHLDWVIENKPFVKIEHDAIFCKFRNIQCDDVCSFFKCQPYWHRKMFEKAKQVIFLSPLQLKLHLRFFWKELGSELYMKSNHTQIKDYEKNWSQHWKEMKKDKVHCIPPCVKKSFMTPSEPARKKGTYCVVGAIYEGKGIKDILEQYNELGKNLRFIGKISDNRLAALISQKGHTLVAPQPYNKMASILQKYEYLLISRRIPKVTTLQDGREAYVEDEDGKRLYAYMNEGFSRITMEAYNCGVKILIDKDSKKVVGRYSYNLDDEEMSKMCNDSDSIFWDTISKDLK